MVGRLHRTFSDPQCASPDASPVLEDHRDLVPAQESLSFFPNAFGSQGLFDNNPQVYPGFNFTMPYNDPSSGLGLGLGFPVSVNPQDLCLQQTAGVYAANTATHHGGAPVVPTPMAILGGGAGPAPLSLSRSFVNFVTTGNVNVQPACINPSELGGVPQLDFPALLAHADLTHCAAEDVVSADSDFEVADNGRELVPESEPEDNLVPSPTSTLNSVPLPDDIKAAPVGKRGKKRGSSGGGPKRNNKRRRSSESDEDEFHAESSEPEADEDDDYHPSGRPKRTTTGRRRSSQQQALDISDGETEAQARDRTCNACRRKFSRGAERVRHQNASACGTKVKIVCPVCHRSMTARNDALRRHQLRTKKCIEVQDKTPRERLDALGCVTLEEREKDAKSQGALKQAGKKAGKKASKK
ncbi:hypothetical protein AURDEDRAFT_116366 [Auricularia subglabra TFB-10046 SS5]|nr:hypothetical protein AURDEDRAFT_116366 [Auricularia subglabra TFB-10046 SS5]